jgi:hypothetical protein
MPLSASFPCSILVLVILFPVITASIPISNHTSPHLTGQPKCFGHGLRGLFPSSRAGSRAEIGRPKLHLAHPDTSRIAAPLEKCGQHWSASIIIAVLCSHWRPGEFCPLLMMLRTSDFDDGWPLYRSHQQPWLTWRTTLHAKLHC